MRTTLRGVVWTAVSAVAVGVMSSAAALCGASIEFVLSLAGLGTILAVLSTRQ